MKFWLYRVLQQDADGDPLDHGVVKAKDKRAMKRYLTKHIDNVLGVFVGTVRVYPLKDADRGVLKNDDFEDLYIDSRPHA